MGPGVWMRGYEALLLYSKLRLFEWGEKMVEIRKNMGGGEGQVRSPTLGPHGHSSSTSAGSNYVCVYAWRAAVKREDGMTGTHHRRVHGLRSAVTHRRPSAPSRFPLPFPRFHHPAPLAPGHGNQHPNVI